MIIDVGRLVNSRAGANGYGMDAYLVEIISMTKGKALHGWGQKGGDQRRGLWI